MKKEKKEKGIGIVVLDEGMNTNASSDAVHGWGMCCWGNFIPFAIR
jgi:hypothetical protein